MNSLQNFYIICTIFFLCACDFNKSTQTEGGQIVINLDEPKEGVIKSSTLFKNIKTIILEESEYSLIGRVDDLQVFDELLYILDVSSAKGLFVFDLNGRFIRKIGGLGRGPGEYTRISDFTIDYDNNLVYILDSGHLIHKYKTIDGSYFETVRINVMNINISYIQYFNSFLFTDACNFDSTVDDDDYLLMKIDVTSGNVIEKYLKKTQYNNGWNGMYSKGNSFFFNRINGIPKYIQIFMNMVITLDGITPHITLESKDLVTERDINIIKRESNFVMQSIAISNITKIHHIHNYIENEEFIQFQYKHDNHFYYVLYDIKSKTSQIFEKIENDLLFNEKQWVLELNYSDINGVYEIIDTEIMDFFVQSVNDNRINPTLDKIDELKKLTEESNPVIFYYEYKNAE